MSYKKTAIDKRKGHRSRTSAYTILRTYRTYLYRDLSSQNDTYEVVTNITQKADASIRNVQQTMQDNDMGVSRSAKSYLAFVGKLFKFNLILLSLSRCSNDLVYDVYAIASLLILKFLSCQTRIQSLSREKDIGLRTS